MGVVKYSKPIEKIESAGSPKIDFSILRKRSNAKTASGIILGYAQRFKKSGNLEMTILFQEIYKQIKDLETKKMLLKKNEKEIISVEIISGWKSKDQIDIRKDFENDFIVEDHIKDKETGEIKTTQHKILGSDVNKVKALLLHWEIGEKIDYREIVPEIMKIHNINISLNSFNGGKNRTKYYFPKYYFPMKILEKLELIKYGGRGQITRLK